ncbi:YqaA family protein [Candidatus Dependentiae bacterium]
MKKGFSWLRSKVHSPYANLIFTIPFLLETFIIFPLDGVIALFCMERKDLSVFYTAVASICSTAGAAVGYFLGAFAWHSVGQKIIYKLLSKSTFQSITSAYSSCHKLILFFGGLIPLPFKMFTIPAGFCKVPFYSFLVCIFFTRLTRYGLIALAMNAWGTRITKVIDRISMRMLLLSGLKLSLLFSCVWILK